VRKAFTEVIGGGLSEVLLRETREELSRADTKAFGLLSFLGIFFGVLFAGVMAGDWSPSDMGTAPQLLWWLGVLVSLWAMAALCAAIWPRIPLSSGCGRAVLYFGDVAGSCSLEELSEGIAAAEGLEPDRTMRQLHALSAIACRKYRHTRAALSALAISLVLVALALLIEYA